MDEPDGSSRALVTPSAKTGRKCEERPDHGVDGARDGKPPQKANCDRCGQVIAPTIPQSRSTRIDRKE